MVLVKISLLFVLSYLSILVCSQKADWRNRWQGRHLRLGAKNLQQPSDNKEIAGKDQVGVVPRSYRSVRSPNNSESHKSAGVPRRRRSRRLRGRFRGKLGSFRKSNRFRRRKAYRKKSRVSRHSARRKMLRNRRMRIRKKAPKKPKKIKIRKPQLDSSDWNSVTERVEPTTVTTTTTETTDITDLPCCPPEVPMNATSAKPNDEAELVDLNLATEGTTVNLQPSTKAPTKFGAKQPLGNPKKTNGTRDKGEEQSTIPAPVSVDALGNNVPPATYIDAQEGSMNPVEGKSGVQSSSRLSNGKEVSKLATATPTSTYVDDWEKPLGNSRDKSVVTEKPSETATSAPSSPTNLQTTTYADDWDNPLGNGMKSSTQSPPVPAKGETESEGVTNIGTTTYADDWNNPLVKSSTPLPPVPSKGGLGETVSKSVVTSTPTTTYIDDWGKSLESSTNSAVTRIGDKLEKINTNSTKTTSGSFNATKASIWDKLDLGKLAFVFKKLQKGNRTTATISLASGSSNSSLGAIPFDFGTTSKEACLRRVAQVVGRNDKACPVNSDYRVDATGSYCQMRCRTGEVDEGDKCVKCPYGYEFVSKDECRNQNDSIAKAESYPVRRFQAGCLPEEKRHGAFCYKPSISNVFHINQNKGIAYSYGPCHPPMIHWIPHGPLCYSRATSENDAIALKQLVYRAIKYYYRQQSFHDNLDKYLLDMVEVAHGHRYDPCTI